MTCQTKGDCVNCSQGIQQLPEDDLSYDEQICDKCLESLFEGDLYAVSESGEEFIVKEDVRVHADSLEDANALVIELYWDERLKTSGCSPDPRLDD